MSDRSRRWATPFHAMRRRQVFQRVSATAAARELLEPLEGRRLFSTYVVTSTDDVISTAANFEGTLRWAVRQANLAHATPTDPSLITFDPNVFGDTPQTISLIFGPLELSAGATTIVGPGADLLTFSGGDTGRVLEAFGTGANVIVVTVSGVTIADGSAKDVNHSADGKLRGGAVYNDASGGMTFTACTFSNNQAMAAGGAIQNAAVLTLSDCSFNSNDVTGESDPSHVDEGPRGGGAIENRSGTLLVSGCTFFDNQAGSGDGGAIFNRAGATLVVANSTFTANSAPVGGALSNLGGKVTVSNSTISDNTATFQGGGIYSRAGAAGTAGTTLNNTIVAGNSASIVAPDLYGDANGGGAGEPFSGGYNLIGKGNGQTNLVNGAGGNLVGSAATPINPKLGPLEGDGGLTSTMLLLDGSPAINAGSNSLVPAGLTTDQRGNGYPRVVDFVDIGAVETGAVPLIVNTTADGAAAPGLLTLREALRLADLRNAPKSSPSVITFDPLVFGTTPRTIALTEGQLKLTRGAAVIAGPGASMLTVSGGGHSRVLLVDNNVTRADISGLRFIDGVEDDLGGGIYVLSTGAVSITACTLYRNTGFDGGGIEYSGGSTATLDVTDCTFAGNLSEAGGGIDLTSGVLTVKGSTFTGNVAAVGGAVCCEGGQTAVINCTMASNTTDADGGAIFVFRGELTVSDSTIARNTAGDGGSGGGGGIAAVHPVTLNNTLVALNTAPSGGPDLFSDAQEGAPVIGSYSGSNNLIGNGADEVGLVGGEAGNQVGSPASPINPKLGFLQFNGGPTFTMLLNPSSPAIDAGSNALVPDGITTDQRGGTYARIGGGKVDIGASEVQGTAPVISFVPEDPAVGGSSSSQRSMVTRLALNFIEPVRPVKGDFALGLVNGNGSGANDGSADTDASAALGTPVNPSGDGVTWFLPIVAGTPYSAAVGSDGTATLGDGIYRLTFATPSSPNAGPAPDGGGTALRAGTALRGGALTQPAQSLTFYRLFGDVNGSKNVNTADFGVFRNAFGKRTGDAGFNAAFDFDGNGTVNNLDFGQFRARLGKSFT